VSKDSSNVSTEPIVFASPDQLVTKDMPIGTELSFKKNSTDTVVVTLKSHGTLKFTIDDGKGMVNKYPYGCLLVFVPDHPCDVTIDDDNDDIDDIDDSDDSDDKIAYSLEDSDDDDDSLSLDISVIIGTDEKDKSLYDFENFVAAMDDLDLPQVNSCDSNDDNTELDLSDEMV